MTTPIVTCTPAAAVFINQWVNKENGIALHLSVKTTGCNGLSYVTTIIKAVDAKDFTHKDSHGLTICIAAESEPYLRGITIDYVSTGLGMKKLTFTNPNARSQCGCGESFNVNK